MKWTTFLCNLKIFKFHNYSTMRYFFYVYHFITIFIQKLKSPSWPWSYDSWIFNYLCNQWCCEFESRKRRGVQHHAIKYVCGFLCMGPPVSSTKKTDRHDITKILVRVALNTIKKNWYLKRRAYTTMHSCRLRLLLDSGHICNVIMNMMVGSW